MIYHERKDGSKPKSMKGVKAPVEATRILERGKNGANTNWNRASAISRCS